MSEQKKKKTPAHTADILNVFIYGSAFVEKSASKCSSGPLFSPSSDEFRYERKVNDAARPPSSGL